MTIGESIQLARKKAGLSQKELGAKLGVSGSMIGQYENDLRRPKAETVQKIADALGTTLLEITQHALDYPLLTTIPVDIDSEYENVIDVLAHAGLCIEAAGYSEGGPEGDHFYVWHEDAEDPAEDRVDIAYRDLVRIVTDANTSADLRRQDYLRKRLDAELF